MANCYCEYVKKYYPNSTLIIVPKDKKEEIQKLIDMYLGYAYYKEQTTKEAHHDL